MKTLKILFKFVIFLMVAPSVIAFLFAFSQGKLPYQNHAHKNIYYIYIDERFPLEEYVLNFEQSQGQPCLIYNNMGLVLIGKRYGSLGLGVMYETNKRSCQ